VWNEPSNGNGGAYGKVELKDKQSYVLTLLPQVFEVGALSASFAALTSGLWEAPMVLGGQAGPHRPAAARASDVLSSTTMAA